MLTNHYCYEGQSFGTSTLCDDVDGEIFPFSSPVSFSELIE